MPDRPAGSGRLHTYGASTLTRQTGAQSLALAATWPGAQPLVPGRAAEAKGLQP